MTRLPWQHNRSRSKSGGEKSNLSRSQDWFTRNTSEPSRQALSALVKVHQREKSDESQRSKSRSRENTVTSPEWHKDQLRTGSLSTGPWSRPTSSHHAREGSVYSSLDRADGTTKALLAKGGAMLRRTGSKMSLSSAASSSTLGFASTPRSHASNTPLTNTSIRGDDIRHMISTPFDFQHVTHTEETQFPGLRCIEESDLAHQFSTATNRQSSAHVLRGIEASDLVVSTTTHYDTNLARCSTSANDNVLHLSGTATRPLPPPKDNIDQQSGTAKPLPQLPIIHAVTTEDNSARAMLSTPIPTPPGEVSTVSESGYFPNHASHQRRQSSVGLPRHMSFYPAAKVSMPNLCSANCLSAAPRTLPRHRSDLALSQQAKQARDVFYPPASNSFTAVDTGDWEDAIDEAWDVADELRGDRQPISIEDRTASDASSLHRACSGDALSMLSIPLMVAPSQTSTSSPLGRASPIAGVETHKLESVQEDGSHNDLAGLGISTYPPVNTQSSRTNSVHFLNRRSSLCRSAGGMLSRSSSQDSIILSLASSIAGTQRSSNSSVVTDDLPNMSRSDEKILDFDHFEEAHAVSRRADSVQATRPESGCLPPDVLKQLSNIGSMSTHRAAVHDESTPFTTLTSCHGHSKSTPKLNIPQRTSSIMNSEHSRASRTRSNTTGNRPRQSTRASAYTLFPSGRLQSGSAAVIT